MKRPDFEKKTTRRILEDNLNRKKPENMRRLKIWLHNIRSMHNTGSAFRSCDAFGCGEILLSGYTPVPPRPEISKTALGAEKHVPWTQLDSVESHIKELKQRGYSVIGVEQTHESILLTEFKPLYDQPVCLLFGNEVSGIDEEILPLLDKCLEIPQFGQKHSLNISVTVGIVLYHMLLNS